MRIVSLLPSATEIVAFLGQSDRLVGVSHACDAPDDRPDLPRVTSPRIDADETSAEIDRQVRDTLQAGISVFDVDIDRIRELDPDVIITQDQCSVCAVDLEQVRDALGEAVGDVHLVSLHPTTLGDVTETIVEVGEAIGVGNAAETASDRMEETLWQLSESVPERDEQPDVLPIEWLDPLMVAGHWVPELITLAGARCSASEPGQRSRGIDFETIRDADPYALLIAPCGLKLTRVYSEMASLERHEGWSELAAVQEGRVWVVDGDRYFNRPAPSLVDSLAILIQRLWPEQFDPEEHDRLIAETLERETAAFHGE